MSFDRTKQIKYFAHHLRELSSPYSSLDTNRMTLVHFSIHALDLLRVWDDPEMVEKLSLNRDAIIDWIYALQSSPEYAGFKGGTFLGGSFGDVMDAPSEYNHGHIAMTYTALSTLTMLGDDLKGIDKSAIVSSLAGLQRPEDGSFQCIAVGSEHDTRFLYCACAISHMLDDWSGVDVKQAIAFIRNCRSFDGAIALIPGQEGHGGSTFCGVAALVLMKKLDEVIDEEWRKELIRWCVHRQIGGMQGRPNKVEDTCYSYWIGATLRLLGRDDLFDHDRLRNFVLSCQTNLGGFAKTKGSYPDILHSYYSLSYLSMSAQHYSSDQITDYGNDDNIRKLKELNCTLGICQQRAAVFGTEFP